MQRMCQFLGLLDREENPLDRRAVVSLKTQLEMDKPKNNLDPSVSSIFLFSMLFFISSPGPMTEAVIDLVPN